MRITKHSGIYTLRTQLQLPIELEQAWDFFSNPKNLAKITPRPLRFEITSGKPERMYQGQIISYKISFIKAIRSNWVTEITTAKENSHFVDEQRIGPYKMWHHEHHFKENDFGVMMTDKVSFALPFGIFGRWAYQLFIKRKLAEIFWFRSEKIKQLFAENKLNGKVDMHFKQPNKN